MPITKIGEKTWGAKNCDAFVLGVVGLLASYALGAGVIQILLISALVVLGIRRIHAVSTRMRRYQVD